MSKKKKVKRRQYETEGGIVVSVSQKARTKILCFYRDKFFNKFLNKFNFGNLDYQQKHYMMKKFWSKNCGQLAFFIIKGTKSELYPNGMLGICPYSFAGVYNMFDFQTKAMLIDTHATGVIPTTEQEVDKDCVLGWITRNKKGVESLIDAKLEELVDVEMTMRCNLRALKMPWVFGTTPENKAKIDDIIDSIDDDDPYLTMSLEDVKNMQVFNTNAPCILDKLEVKRQQLEDDINTILGFNGVGIMEKKEHLTTGEVNMNSEATNANNDIYMDCLTELNQRIIDVLGYDMQPSLNQPEAVYTENDEDDPEDNEEEEENEQL